ncbi:MAG: hypothetical protein HYX20_00665 [Candidatus Yanofskybacteria bacterium]|nr:hypothetical protein [Candidatus Yanofskybacteria bacterium]
MENQTSLIAQDPLTLAIQGAQEAKKIKLEQESQRKKEIRESELAKTEIDTKHILTCFLIRKFSIRSHRVEDILLDKNTRLKVSKIALKSLILRRAALSLHSVSCGVIMFFSLWLLLTGDKLTYQEDVDNIIIIQIFGGSVLIGVIFFYFLSSLRLKLLKRISLGDKILTFKRFFKIIKCLRKNITDLETQQKLIEQA